jgi:3-oxoacyl-[acyl-carrier protein] reductase
VTPAAPLAVITGGSRGIGRAFVLEAARRGHRVLFTYRSRTAEAEALEAEVAASGGVAEPLRAELADPADVAAVVEAALARAPVSVLVNNAGVVADCTLDTLTDELWQEAMAVNLTAPCLLARGLRHALARSSGSILNVSSTGGVVGSVHGVAYGASKAGLIGLSQTLARELAPNVRVNVIAPGPVATELYEALPESERTPVEAETPLGRVGQPEEIARAGLDIAGWGFATGQTVVIDGGRVMH